MLQFLFFKPKKYQYKSNTKLFEPNLAHPVQKIKIPYQFLTSHQRSLIIGSKLHTQPSTGGPERRDKIRPKQYGLELKSKAQKSKSPDSSQIFLPRPKNWKEFQYMRIAQPTIPKNQNWAWDD